MAIYHFAAQVLGRGQGRKNLDGTAKKQPDNAVAAAAYRAGEKLRDEAKGGHRDYSHRDGVAHREIMVPEGGAAWLADRERLWNEVERIESRSDAQLAREINFALPHQLTDEQRRVLVQDFVREQFVARGMVADFALHDPVTAKGDDPRNFHAHVMLTLRKATGAGLHEVKTREWNSRDLLNEWRKAWQVHANRALAREGKRERIDHRTLAEQRAEAVERGDRKAAMVLDRAPEIHVGPRPKAMQGREVEPVSQTRERGSRRRERPAYQLRQAGPQRQSYESFRRERAVRRDKDREVFAAERLQRAEERWERQKAYEERRREQRFRQELWQERQEEREKEFAARKKERQAKREDQAMNARRTRDYPRTDQGPRIGFLWEILAGNNAKLKSDIARIDARTARFGQWMDFQNQRATWWLDGKMGGAAYRFQRYAKAKDAREQRQAALASAQHAKQRAARLQAITTELRQIVAVLSGRQEAGLKRARQVEGWGRTLGREAVRGVEQALGSQRGRQRQAPSGHSGPSRPGGGNRHGW